MKNWKDLKSTLKFEYLLLPAVWATCLWVAHLANAWYINTVTVHPPQVIKCTHTDLDFQRIAKQAMWERMQADNDAKTIKLKELEWVATFLKDVDNQLPGVRVK